MCQDYADSWTILDKGGYSPSVIEVQGMKTTKVEITSKENRKTEVL